MNQESKFKNDDLHHMSSLAHGDINFVDVNSTSLAIRDVEQSVISWLNVKGIKLASVQEKQSRFYDERKTLVLSCKYKWNDPCRRKGQSSPTSSGTKDSVEDSTGCSLQLRVSIPTVRKLSSPSSLLTRRQCVPVLSPPEPFSLVPQ